MRRMRLGAAILIAAMALSACSIGEPSTPAAPPSPTAPPVYPRFVDGRLCDNVRYDLFEGLVPVGTVVAGQPFSDGFGLTCASNDYRRHPEQPVIKIDVFIFDSPEHAQQAYESKGLKPSPVPDVTHGNFDLKVTRSEWTATSGALAGVVFDGNLRIEAGVFAIDPNGHSEDTLKRLTTLIEELIKELRRMAAQVS